MASNPFPVENIPFGVISTDDNPGKRAATIIDDTIIDLSALEDLGFFDDIVDYPVNKPRPFQTGQLNEFAALSKEIRSCVRRKLQELWGDDSQRKTYSVAFLPAYQAHNHVPMNTINYTDYVSSRGHFENLQNLIGTPISQRSPFYHMPTGYYGNSRNIVISGTPVYRFFGVIDKQFQLEGPAQVGDSQRFDFELELGVYLCGGKTYGEHIKVEEADEYVFGFVLLNDWSGRDIQRAESGGPTGPFLAKSGCVTISPWIVTLEAVECARVPRVMKPVVPFVEHLSEDLSNTDPCLDVRCSATWQAADDNHGTYQPTEICRARYQETYWTYRQLLAHQTANGSITGSGDLLGTGTMSMFESDDIGRCCISERTYQGTRPVMLSGGQQRAWIKDGDEIILRGWIHDAKTGEQLFGFGECRGIVLLNPYRNVE